MPAVSFVIPIFKAESYLKNCLQSIQKQTATDFEVFCINDDSPDKSREIIQSFTTRDSRFKLIDLPTNRGPGYARNQGIHRAQGKYIRMVDPDDFLPRNSTEKLLYSAQKYKSDFVRGGFQRCSASGEKQNKGPRFPERELINASFHQDKELWYFDQHCTYLYSTEIIKKTEASYSEEMRNGEDVVFLIQLAPHLNKVTLIPEIVYFYRRNPTSIMLSHKQKDYYLNLFKLYEMEYNQLASKGFREQVDNFIHYHLEVILPRIVFPSIPINLQHHEAKEVLIKLKKIIDKYDIKELCFSQQYEWQKKRNVPLLSRKIIALLSAEHINEAYESIDEYVRNKNKITRQKKRINSLTNSTSWRLTSPLRWLKEAQANLNGLKLK